MRQNAQKSTKLPQGEAQTARLAKHLSSNSSAECNEAIISSNFFNSLRAFVRTPASSLQPPYKAFV